jgi:hypothetical protein
MTDFSAFFIRFQDHLAPKLDVYEQALYLYIARHTIAVGQTETIIGFKSARKKMAFGIGTAGTPPSEGTIYEKLRNLELKRCIKIVSSERAGTRIQIVPIQEIPGVIPEITTEAIRSIDEMDFFTQEENRKLILEREGWRCFYCLVALNSENHVIEHVVSRPDGNSSYRNVVASCRQCNNRKNAGSAEDFLRLLYREGMLSSDDFKGRMSQLQLLRVGELRPAVR